MICVYGYDVALHGFIINAPISTIPITIIVLFPVGLLYNMMIGSELLGPQRDTNQKRAQGSYITTEREEPD